MGGKIKENFTLEQQSGIEPATTWASLLLDAFPYQYTEWDTGALLSPSPLKY